VRGEARVEKRRELLLEQEAFRRDPLALAPSGLDPITTLAQRLQKAVHLG